MPFPKVTKILPQWPNSTESIGDEIMSSNFGVRKIWWPCGPALEKFGAEILPEIKAVLRAIDPGDAEIFLGLYMIGRKAEAANPVIMIYCPNKIIRNRVESHIRASGVLTRHRGFGLGATSLPIGASAPLRLLAGNAVDDDAYATVRIHEPQQPRYTEPQESVASVLETPKIGRRLYILKAGSNISSHYSTGGVVLDVAGSHFQLTVAHLFETDTTCRPMDEDGLLGDLDDCHFDVVEDDIEEEDEDDTIVSQRDLIATSRGSATPEDSQSQIGTPGKASDGVTLSYGADDPNTSLNPRSNDNVRTSLSSNRVYAYTRHHVDTFDRLLDYALIDIYDEDLNDVNCISLDPECDHILRVQNVAPIPSEKRAVVVVTSRVPIKGILIPGEVIYQQCGSRKPQHIFQVQLDSAAAEGDCGSPIIDEKTGDLYGHLIIGAAGSLIAYFISAVEVFQDISRATGSTARLPREPTTHSDPFYNAPSSPFFNRTTAGSLKPSVLPGGLKRRHLRDGGVSIYGSSAAEEQCARDHSRSRYLEQWMKERKRKPPNATPGTICVKCGKSFEGWFASPSLYIHEKLHFVYRD
ncbi:hypothetical protein F5Y04DRAFT_250314 [Hypomontagnella monticulosa]|nr:hypothetical protein F5Y04DRAFT_250314 [Hypomontagnella monticulosa]